MAAIGTANEWLRFLDAGSDDEAVAKIRRMISCLEVAADECGDVLKFMSGSPSADLEEVLRVTRYTSEEAIGLLSGVIARIALGDPEAA
jgi:hypothetical protein